LRGLSRREFLGGAAGVVAVAALPSSPSSHAARTQAAATALAGATVNPSSYGVTSFLDAANIYDGYVGLSLATTFEKVYLGHGALPSNPPEKMTQLASAGCRFLVSIEPSRTMTASEQTLLAKWLTSMNNSGIPYRVVLYSECNDKAFKTAADWFAYWSFYAPVVQAAGVPCGYDPGCGFMAIGRAQEYFPSSPAPDELWMDYYATAFRGGSRLDNLIAMAASSGIPAGMAEWGWAAGDTTFGPMTMPWWNEYGSYLMHLINTGKITLGTINFAAKANGRTVDVINSATDPRIPMIKQMAQTVQAAARTAA
jgi:hypothetical protein